MPGEQGDQHEIGLLFGGLCRPCLCYDVQQAARQDTVVSQILVVFQMGIINISSPAIFPALSLACDTLLCRTCALVLLCTALGGAWSLEQPSGSLLEYFPTWTYVVRKIFDNGGPEAVTSSFGWNFPNSIKTGCQKHLCIHTFKLHMLWKLFAWICLHGKSAWLYMCVFLGPFYLSLSLSLSLSILFLGGT